MLRHTFTLSHSYRKHIHHAMYTHLVLTEKLWKHLEEVDMECNDMMDMLTVRMAEREGVTEHLKSVDQPFLP